MKSLLAPLLALAVPLSTAPAQDVAQLRRRTPVVEVIESARPAVVSIQSNVRRNRWSPFRQSSDVAGTGVVIYEDGYIVTNNHVIQGASKITVRFDEADDASVYEARLVSRVPEEDLALLKIDGDRPFPTIPMTADEPLLGEPVVAIGNALGHTHTVSTGIISGLHRDITASGLRFTNLIQTDASINPGNSGGPLININGELIGINTAMSGAAENIGFAIPVSRVKWVLSEHLLSLSQAPSWLGFEVDLQSFTVSHVEPGGPADDAGLRAGDRIVTVNGERFEDEEAYRLLRLSIQPRQEVRLGVQRDGRPWQARLSAWNRVDGLIYQHLGITVELIHLGRYYTPYLQVDFVHPSGPAADLGLAAGDVIAAVRPEGWRAKKLKSVADLAWLVSTLERGTDVELDIWRDDDQDGIYERDGRVSELYHGTLELR